MAKKFKLLVITAVWGDWHLEKYFKLNLPTLLDKRNFQALANVCEITYLIYTSKKDEELVKSSSGLIELAKFVKLQIKIIPSIDLTDPIATHHNIWARANKLAKKISSFLLLMPPDVAWSSGSFEHLGSLLTLGKKAIFMTYLRVDCESFTTLIKKRFKTNEISLSVSGQELVEIGLRTIHPLMAASIRESEYFPIHPEMMFWAVPKEGLICRVLAREMFIFDPKEIKLNSQNLLHTKLSKEECHVIDDSDQLFGVSLTPFEKEYDWYKIPKKADPWIIADWWLLYDSWINDFIVSTKIRWHTKSIVESNWRKKEMASDLFMRRVSTIREIKRIYNLLLNMNYNYSALLLSIVIHLGVTRKIKLGKSGGIVFVPLDSAYNINHQEFKACTPESQNDFLVDLIGNHFSPSDNYFGQLTLEEQIANVSSIKIKLANNKYLDITKSNGMLKANEHNIISKAISCGNNIIYLISGQIKITSLIIP